MSCGLRFFGVAARARPVLWWAARCRGVGGARRAERAGARRTVELPSASHAAAVSHPDATASLILEAAAPLRAATSCAASTSLATMCFGVPPACTLLAGAGFDYAVLPMGCDEIGIAGAVQGTPIRLVFRDRVTGGAVGRHDVAWMRRNLPPNSASSPRSVGS